MEGYQVSGEPEQQRETPMKTNLQNSFFLSVYLETTKMLPYCMSKPSVDILKS